MTIHRTRTARAAQLFAVGLTALTVAACATGPDRDVTTDPPVPEPAVEGAPGEIVGPVLDFDGFRPVSEVTAQASTIRYRSTDADGRPTVVSGTVFVPEGTAPAGGWPVVSFGHSTSGVLSHCAPSLYPDLRGVLPEVLNGVRRGFVVAVTDYQGLGTAETHPYLDAQTAGRNMIDIVRAARLVVPEASDRWAAFGYSQGGQAVWSTAEDAEDYGEGLDLVGAAALAPATDITGLVDAMVDGTLTEQQVTTLPLLLHSLSATDPELSVDDYLRGPIRDEMATMLECTGTAEDAKTALARATTAEQTRPVDQAAADRLRAALARYTLPSRPTDVPLYVAFGGRDELVLPSWTVSAVEQACAMGTSVTVTEYPEAGHTDLDASGPAVAWLEDRFAGDPVPDACM